MRYQPERYPPPLALSEERVTLRVERALNYPLSYHLSALDSQLALSTVEGLSANR